MYVTAIVTKTESGDDGLYMIHTDEIPTSEQIEWYVKENGAVFDNLLYEHVINHQTVSTEWRSVEATYLHDADPCPEVETM